MTTNNETFVRQKDNPGSVLNTDSRGLEAYKKRKQRENEIDNLKNDVSEIKNMLHELLKSKEDKE